MVTESGATGVLSVALGWTLLGSSRVFSPTCQLAHPQMLATSGVAKTNARAIELKDRFCKQFRSEVLLFKVSENTQRFRAVRADKAGLAMWSVKFSWLDESAMLDSACCRS